MLTNRIKRKKNGYWTKEACRKEAVKCKTRSEFMRKYGSAYAVAVRNGWLVKICSHMAYLKTPDGFWTKETCQGVALKCNTRSEFIRKYSGAYDAARNNGFIDDICSHMTSIYQPDWTKQSCTKEALIYNTKSEFRNNSSAYSAAHKKGWIDEICKHMKRIGNRRNKLIYAYEFPDKAVYIGLTYNINDRQSHRDHDEKDAVTKHKKRTKLNPIIKLLTDYMSVDEAIKAESKYIQKYVGKGWKILNRAKGGAIGGNEIKWTYDACKELALKCKNRSEFYKKSSGASHAALVNGWIDEIFSHMKRLINPNGTWTKKACWREALKYLSRKDFAIGTAGAYQSARQNCWLNEICSHMIVKQKPIGYWTNENCRNEAFKYKSKVEFRKKNSSAYSIAGRNGWLNEVCKHMTKPKPILKWTKEECQKESLKYISRKKFAKGSSGAYSAALKKGWIDEVCSHMQRLLKSKNYWTKDECQEEAAKYKTRSEFRSKSSSAYSIAVKNNWLI